MNEGEDAGVELRSYLDALDHGQGPPPARDRQARRGRLVPALRTHIAREHRRVRRRRVWIRGATLVAAGSAAAIALVMIQHPGLGLPVVTGSEPAIALLDGTLFLGDGAHRRTLRPGETMTVGAADGLEAPAAETARVQLASAATLTLAPSSRVGRLITTASTAEAGSRIEAVTLVRGRAHLKVTKLHGAQRFHVLTPDADVEVRGTEFDVELRPRATPGTCVRVQEGLVAVATGGEPHLVSPGQTWGCAPVPVPQAAQRMPAVTVVAPVADAAQSPSERRAEARARASDLRIQNRLFQSALEAERGGNFAEAAQRYHRLLARSPRGPLAAQARSNLAVVSRPR
jgi:hypothetical protein